MTIPTPQALEAAKTALEWLASAKPIGQRGDRKDEGQARIAFARQALADLSHAGDYRPACRNCGSLHTVEELKAAGYTSCCPERDIRALADLSHVPEGEEGGLLPPIALHEAAVALMRRLKWPADSWPDSAWLVLEGRLGGQPTGVTVGHFRAFLEAVVAAEPTPQQASMDGSELKAEGPQPTRVEGEDLEWLTRHLNVSRLGTKIDPFNTYNARIDRILAALSSPPPPSGGELARAVEALRKRAKAWRLNDDGARVSVKLGDLRTVLATLPQTRTGEGE